jgi:hypothetical protein
MNFSQSSNHDDQSENDDFVNKVSNFWSSETFSKEIDKNIREILFNDVILSRLSLSMDIYFMRT